MSNAYAYGICIKNAYGSDDVASEAARYVGDIVAIREYEDFRKTFNYIVDRFYTVRSNVYGWNQKMGDNVTDLNNALMEWEEARTRGADYTIVRHRYVTHNHRAYWDAYTDIEGFAHEDVLDDLTRKYEFMLRIIDMSMAYVVRLEDLGDHYGWDAKDAEREKEIFGWSTYVPEAEEEL